MENRIKLITINENSDIERLELPIRQYNLLKNNGIETIGDLLDKTLEELTSISRIGDHSKKIILKQLEKYGLRLKGETKLDLNNDIEILNLRDSIENFLKECNIFYISELIEYTEEDLAMLRIMKRKNNYEILGEKRAEKVSNVLKKHGLKLKENKHNGISKLKLSVRTYNILKTNNIDTIDKLIELTDEKVLRIDCIGRKSLEEIQSQLKKKNLELKKATVKKVYFKSKKMNTDINTSSISSLNLTGKTYNALMRLGINTIDKLLSYSYQDLVRCKRMGKITIREINECLEEEGLKKITM